MDVLACRESRPLDELTCNLYLAMFSSACNLKIMIARRNFDELVQQWPVNDDEVEMIRRHLLQLVTENGQT